MPELYASSFSGVDWVAKLNAACASLPSGGTVIVDDVLAGNATTAGTIPSNVTVKFTGCGVFGINTLNIGKFTKLYATGAKLLMLQPNVAGISLNTSGSILQSDDHFVLDGIRIDCGNQSNSTGIYLGVGEAKGTLKDVEAVNGTTGIFFDSLQFISTRNVHLWNNVVGFKVYSNTLGGGGNSNTFADWRVIGCQVGGIIKDIGPWGMGSNYFDNPNFLENKVCALAIFGNSSQNTAYWNGGCPELNATSASANIVVDGVTIPKCTLYLNKARFTMNDVNVADAQAATEIIAENNTDLILNNVSGYGNTGGQFVSADATSVVVINGALNVTAGLNNVVSYPSAIKPGQVKLVGAPIVVPSTTVQNLYTGNPLHPAFSDTLGGTGSTAVDPILGTVSVVTHGAVAGSQDGNRFRITQPFTATLVGNQDYLLSVLVKSNTTIQYGIGLYGDNFSQLPITLTAGVWQRVLIVVGNRANNYGITGLVGFPKDTSAPVISLARLETYAGPAGSFQARQGMAQIISTGAINLNGFTS